MKNAGLIYALLTAGALAAQAQDVVIQSIDSNGRVTFNEVSNAAKYRVEWAPAVAGPWTNFATAAAALDDLPHTGSGMATCAVPMVYRVVATLAPAAYLVIDLSGGPSASSYPVSYRSAVPVGGWTDEYKGDKLVLRKISKTAPESFSMGCPTNELGYDGSESPQHAVTLTRNFYIGVFEVTQKQWYNVMGAWPSYFTNAAYRDTRPVESVSYYQVRENPLPQTNEHRAGSAINPNWPQSSQVHPDSFMGKLRAKTGLGELDLPSEAQWEYACRAGTTTALNSGYNLTNEVSDTHLDVVGRYWWNGGEAYSQGCAPSAGTALAGSYQANAWGLYDMHGNVWELCLDWSGVYTGAVTDPPGAEVGSYRVIRGGCWRSEEAVNCRSANRNSDYPDYWDDYLGFRLARTLP